MSQPIKQSFIAGFFLIVGAFIPLIWGKFVPPRVELPYYALTEKKLEIGGSTLFDRGDMRVQVLKIDNQPHRFRVKILDAATQEKVDFPFGELAKNSLRSFEHNDRTYTLHVLDLNNDGTSASEAVLEIVRRK